MGGHREGATLAGSQAKAVESVEALWKSVKVCQEVFSGAMTTLSLLTAQELDDLFHGRRVGNGVMRSTCSKSTVT